MDLFDLFEMSGSAVCYPDGRRTDGKAFERVMMINDPGDIISENLFPFTVSLVHPYIVKFMNNN